MIQDLFNRAARSLGLCAAVAVMGTGLAASPALAGTTTFVDTSWCSAPQVSQPFLSAKDSNWYALASGQTVDNFDGGGWTLSGGAHLTTTQLGDGQTGSVLDLPKGSQAVSPTICVQSDYPTARTLVQNGPGANIAVAVAYAGTKSWDKPTPAGGIKGAATGWALSNPFRVHPGNLPGWQLVQFTFANNGKGGDADMYNFYIDPRMH